MRGKFFIILLINKDWIKYENVTEAVVWVSAV